MALPLLPDSLASAAQSELPSSLGACIPGLEQAELVSPFLGPATALIQRAEGVLCKWRTHISIPCL